jgi:RES domain
MPDIAVAYPPEGGLWRVARGEPFALRPPPPPLLFTGGGGVGNRFDSALGNYRVWYFATELEGCYAETLAPLRPDPAVIDAIGKDEDGLMPFGEIAADWRQRRIAVRATFPEDRPFLDVEATGTRAVLRKELASFLANLGLDDIDVPAIRSKDRRLTRIVSQWTWEARETAEPRYAGIRFCSRLGSEWECWAVFEDVLPQEEERRPILREDEALQRVASLYDLRLF